MHVFVATPQTQGTQPDDHYCCLDGEIVIWDTTSMSDHGRDDICDCLTGFFGAYTGGRSTTAMVADDPAITEVDLLQIVRQALLDETGSTEDAEAITQAVAAFAARFAPGDVLTRDRDRLTPRWICAGSAEWGGHSHPMSRGAN